MAENASTTGVVKSQRRTKVTVASITKGNYQKDGTMTAELRQKVQTTAEYPAIQVANEMQQNVFGTEEFNAETKVFTNEEIRVAWIDVPEKATVADVQKRIAADATLYRVLSNEPIITSSQQNAIGRGLITRDQIANAQVLRYPDNHEKAGQLILDKEGFPQYRKVFFWTTKKEDIDLRDGNSTPYASKEIMAEMKQMGAKIPSAKPVSAETVEVVLSNDEEWQS